MNGVVALIVGDGLLVPYFVCTEGVHIVSQLVAASKGCKRVVVKLHFHSHVGLLSQSACLVETALWNVIVKEVVGLQESVVETVGCPVGVSIGREVRNPVERVVE